ncbi:MAG: diacylglycerol kinase family protein [Anaerolineae bacterium]
MNPHNPNPTLIDSFHYASAGLWVVVRTQRNFRIHLGVAVAAVVLGAWLGISLERWAVLVVTIGSVLVAEISNTAAEALVDLASPDYHPLAKQVKDMAAAAVMLTAGVAVVVGLLLLGPPLLARIF